jgi:microcystin-dependent protein
VAYIPEVGTGRIEDGGIEFVDLSPTLQAMISGGLPVGAAIVYEGTDLPANWLWEDGAEHSRSTYANLLNALTTTRSGTLTTGTPNVTGMASTKDIRVGCPVEGSGIPAGTTVAAVVSPTALTLSQNATLSGTQNLTFFPHGNGNGSTTFNVPDSRGRVEVAPDNMGNNGSAGILGASEFGISHKFGQHSVALTPAQTPLRTHTHSGTTNSQNASHSHSASTSGVTANHVHAQQNFLFPNTTRLINTTAGTNYRMDWGGAAQNTGIESVDHGHSVSVGTENANHQHTFTTGNPSVAEANGAAHPNVQPSRIANKIIYAGV